MSPQTQRFVLALSGLVTGLATPTSAIGLSVVRPASSSVIAGAYDPSGGVIDGTFYGSPDWLDPIEVAIGGVVATADADFRIYPDGAVFQIDTTAGITEGAATGSRALWADTWFTFDLLEETAYTITGGFRGTIEAGSGGGMQALLYVALYSFSEADLYFENDHVRVSAGTVAFELSLDEAGAGQHDYHFGSRSGTLPAGTYAFHAVNLLEGSGDGSGEGHVALQLGQPSPVSDSGRTLVLLGIGLVGLAGLRRHTS